MNAKESKTKEYLDLVMGSINPTKTVSFFEGRDIIELLLNYENIDLPFTCFDTLYLSTEYASMSVDYGNIYTYYESEYEEKVKLCLDFINSFEYHTLIQGIIKEMSMQGYKQLHATHIYTGKKCYLMKFCKHWFYKIKAKLLKVWK